MSQRSLVLGFLAAFCLWSAPAGARLTKVLKDPEMGFAYTLVQAERGDTQSKLVREYAVGSLAELDRLNGNRLQGRRPTNPKATTKLSGYNLLWVGEWITVKTTDPEPPAVWSFVNQRPDRAATPQQQMVRLRLDGTLNEETRENMTVPAGAVIPALTFQGEVWDRTLVTQQLKLTTWVVAADTLNHTLVQTFFGRFDACGNGTMGHRKIPMIPPMVIESELPPSTDTTEVVTKPDTVSVAYTERVLWESDVSMGGGAIGSEPFRKGEQFFTGTLSHSLIQQWVWANVKVDWNRSSDYSFIQGGQTEGMWTNLDSRLRLEGGLRLNTPGGRWNVRVGTGPEWVNGTYGGLYYEIEPDLHIWRMHFHPMVGVSPWANFQQEVLRTEFDITRNWPAPATSLRLITEARLYTEPGLDPWNSEWGQVHGGVGLGLWNRRGRPSGLYVMVGDSPFGSYVRTGLYVRTARDTYDPPWKGEKTIRRIYPAQTAVAQVAQPPELASVTFALDIRRWITEGKIKEGADLWYALKLWTDSPGEEWEHVYVAGGPLAEVKDGESYPLSWEEDVFKQNGKSELQLNGGGIYRADIPGFPVGQQVQYRYAIKVKGREDLVWMDDYDYPRGGRKNQNSVRLVTPSVERAPELGL